MTDKSSKALEAMFPGSGYIFVQSLLLFAVYGLGYSLPWWVKWFPTMIYGIFLSVTLLILLIVGIISAIVD